MNLILIRHGESEGNVDKSIYTKKQDHLIELTSKGVNDSFEVGKKLVGMYCDALHYNTPLFYVSTFTRTRQTAKEILKSFDGIRVDVVESPLIIEQQIGNYRSEQEIKNATEYGRFYYRFPTGENGFDVYKRCNDFIEKVKRENRTRGSVFVVTHAYTMRVMKCILENDNVDNISNYPKPLNCEIMNFKL